jgi:asparagine synthase (glutamine-hydrolysing)
MSGFVAIVNIDGAPVDLNLLEGLTDLLRYRGPDQRKVWVDGPVGFGHTLFQTTHESQYERQPGSLDGEVWVTASARIDGRRDLVDKLGAGDRIRLDRTPDSELILHAYRAWGEKSVDRLLGDFAFALWDNRHKKLLCARDRFGMRQLYYARAGNSFVASNSLRCMLRHPSISKRLDDQAIGDFLLFGDHTWLDKTVTAYADIRALAPAHTLVLNNGNVSIRRYWDVPLDAPLLRYRKERDYLEHFQDVFKTAVADRIRTRRIAISMSGGMDSSSIAATVRRLQKEQAVGPLEVTAVTAVFDRVHPCRERYYSGLVGRSLALPVHYVSGDDYPLLKPAVATTRPIELYNPAFWLEFNRQTAAHGRVVLTGAAADNLLEFSTVRSNLREINPGRVLIDLVRLRRRYGVMPPLGTGLLARLKRGALKRTNRLVSPYPYPPWLNPVFEKKEGLRDRWAEWLSWRPSPLHPRHPGAHNALVGPDWNTDDLYFVSDFPFPEERDPFLDLRLIEFIFSLSSLPWLFKKHLLRRAMAKELPSEITSRPKTPLGNLHDSLLMQPENSWVDRWDPIQKLSAYVERTKIPPLANSAWAPKDSYVHLRPLLFNTWMAQDNNR